MKKILLIVSIALLLCCCIFGLYNYHSDRKDRNKNVLEMTKLKCKGNEFLKNNMPDSAMKCYLAISVRYNESMSDIEKDICVRSINNEGYLYFFYYHNNLQAYELFLKALDISENISDTKFLPRIYLNIGNVFDNYNDLEKAVYYYKLAYYNSLKVKDWDTFFKSFSNMAAETCANNSPVLTINRELKQFAALNFPDSVKSLYVIHLYRGLKKVMAHNYKQAQCEFDKAISCVGHTALAERDIAKINLIKSKIYVQDGHYDLALKTLRSSLNIVNNHNDYDLLSSIYEWMASYNLKLGNKHSADTCMIRAYEIDRVYFSIQKFTAMRDIKSMYELKKKNDYVAEIQEKRHIQSVVFFILLTCSGIVIFLCVVLYIGKRRQLQMIDNLYHNMLLKLNNEDREQKYKSSTLEDDDKRKMLGKIIDVMKTCEEVYQLDFNFERFVEILGERPRYVSQVINELCEKNFNALLAEYRIREACNRMRDKENYGRISIEGIGLSVGFKSRTNFAKIFKRETGLTPSEFYKMTILN